MDIDEGQIKEWYDKNKAELNRWGEYVDNILNSYVETLFSSKEHVQIQAKHRVKDYDSLCKKILYRGKKYEFPLLEVTDKVGTRLVLLNSDDVEKVSSFVRGNQNDWTIVKCARDVNNEILKQPEVFSYQSNHFIIKPNSNYQTSIDTNLLTCEIQIRTILQHAYAEVSHDTVYKKHVEKSTAVKRRLASSMAFIEAADEKFIQIYKEMDMMDDIYTKLQNHLISLFRSYISDFKQDAYDISLSSLLLELLDEQELKEVEENIEIFSHTNQTLILNGIKLFQDTCLLFSQPIVVFAAYIIVNYQNRTIQKWPFNYESLRMLVLSMDISDDILTNYIG